MCFLIPPNLRSIICIKWIVVNGILCHWNKWGPFVAYLQPFAVNHNHSLFFPYRIFNWIKQSNSFICYDLSGWWLIMALHKFLSTVALSDFCPFITSVYHRDSSSDIHLIKFVKYVTHWLWQYAKWIQLPISILNN